jgi:hypothetical protein
MTTNIVEAPEKALIRVTIVDGTKTITMPADTLLTRQIVAACASDPESLEDLLLAAEPLRPGLTQQVINALLRFDQVSQARPKTGMLMLDPASAVFEAIDPGLEELSMQGLPGGLTIFDLEEKMIYCAAPSLASAGQVLKREDVLPVVEKGQPTRKTITYSLDKSWKVLDLATAPELLAGAYKRIKSK